MNPYNREGMWGPLFPEQTAILQSLIDKKVDPLNREIRPLSASIFRRQELDERFSQPRKGFWSGVGNKLQRFLHGNLSISLEERQRLYSLEQTRDMWANIPDDLNAGRFDLAVDLLSYEIETRVLRPIVGLLGSETDSKRNAERAKEFGDLILAHKLLSVLKNLDPKKAEDIRHEFRSAILTVDMRFADPMGGSPDIPRELMPYVVSVPHSF